jgi:phosphatidylglycerol:prolipoprotein diacylglycerol transferase
MIDPVIFSFKLIYWTITLRWYGVLVMLGALVGAWWAEREIRRRGENGEVIWDAMVWVLPIGIIGARLWYVVNNILSGSTYYLDDPIRIINIPEGGLHFFGGLLFGMIALYFFLQRNKLDTWLFLDALAPATLLGQAIARPANFINQELYGPPTNLPWGIQIMAEHRLAEYPASQFPVDITRFHPTFAYEMILNFLIVLFLWWLSRRYEEEMKPGAIFSLWLLLAGLSRTFIEFFRPDQPRIGETFISYTMLVSFLMAVAGLIMLLARYGKLQFAWAENWEDEYQVKKAEKKEVSSSRAAVTSSVIADPVSINEKVSSKKSTNAILANDRKKVVAKKVTKKPAPKKTSSSAASAKKSVTKKTTTAKRKAK